jgi:hypothetical protein
MSNVNPNQVTLVSGAIPAAGTYVTPGYYAGRLPAGAKYVAAQANFVRSSGGTTVDVYVQTSLDDEATWCDVANFSFATTSARKVSAVKASTALAANVTPTDGAITANTILSGLIGTKFRVKYVVVGTYVGTLRVDLVLR